MSKFNIDSWISGEEPEKKEPNSEKRSGGFDIDSWIGDNAKSDTTPPPDSSSRSVEKYESEKADEGKVQLRDMNAGNARLKMSEVGNNVENVEMPKHVARAEEIDVDGMKVRADGIEYDGVKTPIGGYVNVETPHGVRTMRLKEISEGKPILEYDEDAVEKNYKKYGLRNDGKTYKGTGWLGELKTANGDVATEYTSQSNAVRDKNGKRINFPTLVPTLTKEEIKEMTEDVIPNQKPVPDAIMQKAVDHALKMQKEGKSVFANDGVYLGGYGAGVTLPGDKFEKMLKDGKVKYDMTAAEQIRLNAEAETGDKKYGKGALGQTAAILKRTIDPVLFNAMSIEERNTLNDLAELRLGRVGQQHNRVDDSLTAEDRKKAGRAAEAAMPNDDATWADKAVRVGIDEKVARRAEGEGVNDYRLRIAGEADKLFKERLQRIAEANNKISQTEKTALDKILVGGAESLGYQYGFGVGVKAGAVLRSLMPYAKGVETAAEIGLPAAMSFGNRYTELTSDEYKLDKAGNPVKVAEGDSPAVGAAKAAIGAVAEAAIEKFGGDVIDKGVGAALKGVGSALKKKKWSGPLLEFGRNFGNFTKATQLNSPVGEVFEEDLQYVFDDMLGLNKKGSEKNDTIAKAFNNDKDKYGRLSARGHLDTFLSLIGLIGAQAAVSAGAAAIDAPRMIHNAEELNGLLASAGVSKDNIQRMSPEEREQLRQIWNECSQNPEKARELLNKTNGFLKDSADEIVDQMNVKLAEDIASSGMQPVSFTIPTEANGTTPLFTQQAIEDNITGEVRTANVATDDKTKVAIRDNGDGTFTVINMLRGGMDTDCNDLASAQKLAQSFALSNQRSVIERNSKLRLIQAVKQGKFNGLDVVVMNNADELKARLGNLAQGQNLFGLTLMDMMSVPSNTESMTTPNGVVLMFADALQSPNAVADNLSERVKDFKPEAIEGRNGSLAYGDDIMGRFSIQEPQTQETEENTSTTTDTTNDDGSGNENDNSQTPQDKVDVFKGYVDAATQLVKDYNYSGNEDDALREKIWQNKKQFREWLKSLSSEELDDLLIQLPEDRDGVFGEYYMDVERAIKYSKNNGSKNKAYEQFKAKPIKDENGKLISPFAGEARNDYIQARLKEMGVDGKSATDEQMKQIEAEIAEIEKPYLDEVKNQKKSSNKNNLLVRGSIRRFIDTHNVGEDGFLGALEFMGIYSIPVDYNLTQRGGKVVFKKGDPAVDHIKKLLDGYGELRMSKSGKIYLKGRRLLPSHLRVLFGDSFKVGGNDNAIERFYAEVFGRKPEDTIGADYGEIDAQIQKEYAMYQAWSAKQKHSNKLEGMTTPKAMKRLDELHGIENPTQKEKDEIRALEAWISDRIDEVQKLIDEYHTEEDVLADEDNYEKLNRELRMLNGDIPYAEPAVNWGNGEEYYIEDLENRLTDDMAAQREYDEALVEVNRFNADSNEVQAFNESNLANLKRGDTIRFDHAGNEMDFYSFEDGVLTVAPLGTVSAGFDIDEKNLVKYQVTEDGFKKIGDNKNGRNNTKDTNDVQPGDEEGERTRPETPERGRGLAAGGGADSRTETSSDRLGRSVVKAGLGLDNLNSEERKIAENALKNGIVVSAIPAISFREDDGASFPITSLIVKDSTDAARLFQHYYTTKGERAKVVYLGKNGEVLGLHIFALGMPGESLINGKYILDHIPAGTDRVIIAHNHPSGQPNANAADVRFNGKLSKLLKERGIDFNALVTDTDSYYDFSDGKIHEEQIAKTGIETPNIEELGKAVSNGHLNSTPADLVSSYLSSKCVPNQSWLVGMDAQFRIVAVAMLPKNGDYGKILEQMSNARTFAIGVGKEGFNGMALLAAMDNRLGKSKGKGSGRKYDADIFWLVNSDGVVKVDGNVSGQDFQNNMRKEIMHIVPKKEERESPATKARREYFDKLADIKGLSFFRSGNTMWLFGDYNVTFPMRSELAKNGFKYQGKPYMGFQLQDINSIPQSSKIWDMIDESPNGIDDFIKKRDANGKKKKEVSKVQSEEDKEKKRKEEQGKILDRPEFNVSKEQQKKEAEDLDIDDLFETKGVFTGSAADYDKPSLQYIGSGEGSQVYGWGLYGSNVFGIAKYYSEMDLEDKIIPAHVTRDGIPTQFYSGHRSEDSYRPKDIVGIALTEAKGDVNATKSLLEKYLINKERAYNETQSPFNSILLNNAKDAVKDFAENANSYEYVAEQYIEGKVGKIYEQTFFTNRPEGDESHLLKWYEPVSEENIERIKSQLIKEGWTEGRIVKTVTGNETTLFYKGENERDFRNKIYISKHEIAQELYTDLRNLLDSPKAASEFLARADIDGIKYPVDSYGGKGVKDGDEVGWNYVSFRDDNIRVDHKWRDGEQLFEEKTPIQEDTRSRIEKVYADWVEEDMPDWVNSLNENEARGYAHLLEVASKANGDITAMKRLEAFENKHKTAYEAPAKAEEQKRVDEAEAARKAEEEAKRKESEKKRQEIADRIARLSNPKFRDGTKMAMLALNIGNALRRGDIPKKAMAMGKAMVGGENGTLAQQWKDNSVLGVVDNASKRQLDNWVEMAVRDKKYELPHEGDVDKWVNPIRNTAGDQVADDLKTMFMRAINDVRSRRGETEHQDFFWGVGGQGEFWHMYGEEKPRNKRGKKINDGTMQMTLFEEKTPITPEEDAAYMDAVKRGDMETAARMVDDVERMEAIRFCGNLKIPQQNGKHSTAKHILSKLEKKTEKNRYPLSYDSSKSVVSLGEGMSYNDAICTLAMLAMSKMPVGGYNFEGVGEYLRDKYSLFAYTDNISQAAIALQDRFSRKYYASTTLGLNAFSVKQSDPITYDDKGNVIPLSQRFNPDNSSSLYEEKAPIAETKMDKVMNFGIRTASSFFKESEDKSFDAFVKYADDSLGEKANVLHRLYGSWYVNAALSLPDDMRDAIDLQASSKARALAGLTPRGKDAPGHRVANVIQEHLIPSASEHVNEASYNGGLDADQRLGVNLALDSVNKPNGHFMLADGTGFGKTRQILAIADQFKSTNPNARILIITKSDEVLSDAFAKDAKAMGIDTSRFTMGTYPGLGLGKFNNGEWDLVLLDEAHLVSNPASLRSQNLWRMRIKHKVFATATPMDRPTDATYFMAELNNISQETLAERLGYRIEVRAPEGSDPYQVAVPMAGQDFNSVKRNVIVERDKAIAGGKMIRRAYPFLGDIDMEYTIPMSNDNRNNDGEVAAYADTQINKLKYLPQIKFYNSITRRELVYKRSDYEDNPDGWLEIVERKKHELNTDKTNAWDNLNESAKAEEAAKVAENILNNNPDARVIIVGQQVGVRTIDGGSLSKPEELMKLKGIERVIQFGRVKYKVEPSLEIAKRRLDALGLGGDVQMLTGKTPKKSRQGIVDNFVGHNKRILIMTQAVGGTGINLDDTDGTHPTYMLVLNKGYSAKELDQLLGRVSRKNTKSFANALFLSNNSMADTHNVRTMGAKMNILKAIQGGADMDALGDMSNDRSSDGEGVLHEEKSPLQSESENDTILGNEQNSDNDKADISSSMNSIKMPEEIISAINAIPDADFEKIYHGSKQDFLTSGISVKFATLASDVDALFDRTENTIFIDNKLRTNIDELTKAFRHELVHVRQVREGNNEPKGFDPFNAISAFKYIMDPGETEADYFANGLFDEYDELMKLIREDWSDDFADVEIGEVKIEDWKKNIVSPIGIRKLQQSAKNNRDLGEVLNKIEAKDSNLPAKLEEVGERLMEGENRLLVSTELGWPITNPSAYKKVTVPNGKARMEIRGRTDETTGKRKSINPVAIAEKLKEMGIEAHAVGPSEIDIFATPETVSNIKKINILRNRSIEYNEGILHEEKAAITPEEDAAYADAVERGDMETARKMVREAAAKAMPNTKVVDKDGLPKVVYHGTQNEFTVFDPYWDANSDSHNPNRARGLVYFATTKEGAFRAGKGTKIMSCFINAKKVRGYGGPGIYWGDVENPKYIAKCKKEGFDAIRVRDEGHGTIAVFSPSQIKSADPVTYDDAGNVIPLSQRFNPDNPSILYEEKANIGEEEQELRFFYNAAVDDWRTKHNMSELASIAKVSVAELNRRVNRLMNNPREVETIISVIESWPTGQTATAEEQALMGKMLVKAEGVYNDMFNQRKAAEEAGNKELADTLAVQMEMYWPTVDRIQRANQKIGNAAGRALQARQLGVANDYSLAAVERRVRNAIGDSRLSPEQRKYLERMVKDADRAGILADEEKRNAFLIRMDETIRDIMAGAKNEVSAKVLTAKGKKQIEIEYDAALNNIWHHGTTHGGTIVGLPRGKKWLDAIQRYHLALGEGYTDGKPDEQKMIELIIADCESKGVIATPWEIRQILSQMGFSITPPKTQLELDRRELNTQHLIQQQIDFINKFGELPPTTGYNRDAATMAVRALQKERRRLIKEKGLDAKNEDGRLKSALGSLKTRLRNRIEELENAVKTNTPIAKGEKRELSDDEVVMLRAQLKKAKEAYDAIFPKNQEEVLESKVIRTVKMLGKIRDEWQAILDNAKATGDFDKTDAEPSAVSKDPRVIAAKEEIKRIKGEWQQLKDALYPNGTAKEIDKRIEKRIETYENEIDRLDKILFNAEIGSSFEDKRKELAKAKKERNSDEAVNNDPRVIQRKADLKRKRAEIDAFIAKLAKEDEPGIVKVGEKLDTIFNVLPRAIKTMLDQSQILSQGLFATGRLAVSDPKAVGRAIADAFKVFASQEAADSVNEMLANDIYFQDFKKLGGRVYGAADSGGKAEEFRGTERKIGKLSVDMIPGVKASERSFTTYLNLMNAALYRVMIEGGSWGEGGPTQNERESLVDGISTITGSSTKGERASAAASWLFFAPRYAMATLKLAMLHPLWSPFMVHGKDKGVSDYSLRQRANVSKEMAKTILPTMLAVAAFQAIMNALFNPDDEDEKWQDFLDLRSSDFLAARVGNGRYNMLKPITIWWTLLARLVNGNSAHYGVEKPVNFSNTVGQLIRGKFSPMAGLLTDIVTGKTYVGEELDWGKFSMRKRGEKRVSGVGHLIESLGIPLYFGDVVDNYRTNNPIAATVLSLLSFFGTRVSSYEDEYERTVGAARTKMSKVNTAFNNAQKNMDKISDVPDAESRKDGIENIRSTLNEVREFYQNNKGSISIAQQMDEAKLFDDLKSFEKEENKARKLGMDKLADKYTDLRIKTQDQLIRMYRKLQNSRKDK